MPTPKSPWHHLYGRRWQRRRLVYLAERPLCVVCEKRGLIRAATVVDHRVPHKGDLVLFWDEGNWQALCKTCHDSYKQALEHGVDRSGCDANGMPLSAGHHWYHP